MKLPTVGSGHLMKTVAWLMLAAGMANAQCVISDFTPSPNEHIIQSVDEPLVVRSVKGAVLLGDGSPLERVLFEIQGPAHDRTIRVAVTDRKGRFDIRPTPEGRYCFKATKKSFQSIMGVIVVSRKAPKKRDIQLDMNVGQ